MPVACPAGDAGHMAVGIRDLPHWEAPHATLEAIERLLDEGPG
jgi:hypothetical protein